MEKLKGGPDADEIVGDDDPLGLATSPLGTPGDDKIEGYRGDDFVVGDAGNDIMKESRNGADIMFGGAGDDTMDGGDDPDEMYGMTGDDTMKGGKGNDVMFGNWGNDDIRGGDGDDFIDCGEDPDGLDEDIARVTEGEDTWVNCETVLDEKTGLPIVVGICGDGTLNVGEQCDDGNNIEGDGCSAICVLEFCGDGMLDVGETCDDGNKKNNDGCNSMCQAEFCGDGVKQTSEACDDGNNDNGDGCSSTCEIEPSECGNGILEAPEACDDGNLVDGDGCSSTCEFEPICGNGLLEGTEACDDGNLVDGDGCSSTCEIEVIGQVDGFMLSNEADFDPSLSGPPFEISLSGSLFLKLTSDDDIDYDNIKKTEFEIKGIKPSKAKVKGTLTQGPDGVFTIEVMSSVLNSVFFDGDLGTIKLKVEDNFKKKLEFKNIPVTFVP